MSAPRSRIAHDPTLGAVAADALDARDDAVAVHRLIQVAAGDEEVAVDVLERPVGHDEPEAPRIGHHPADDQVHPVRQTEPVAARLNQGAALDEVREQLLEGGALLRAAT